MLSEGLTKNNNTAPVNDAGTEGPFFKPAVQRKEDATPLQQVPQQTWSRDLLTIIVFDDSYKGENCFGSASPGEVLRLSSCLKWPSCRTFSIPFRVEFYIDRMNAPHPAPIEPGPVSINITFTPNGGSAKSLFNKTDAKPVYKGPNLVLEPSFGKVFNADIDTDGVLNMTATLHDNVGGDVVYTDSASLVVLCS